MVGELPKFLPYYTLFLKFAAQYIINPPKLRATILLLPLPLPFPVALSIGLPLLEPLLRAKPRFGGDKEVDASSLSYPLGDL